MSAMADFRSAELGERGGGRREDVNLISQDLEAARERVWRKRRAVPSALSCSDCFVRAAGDPIAEYREPIFEWEMRRDVWFFWDFVPPNANTEMRDKHPNATFATDQKMLDEALNRLKRHKSSPSPPLPEDLPLARQPPAATPAPLLPGATCSSYQHRRMAAPSKNSELCDFRQNLLQGPVTSGRTRYNNYRPELRNGKAEQFIRDILTGTTTTAAPAKHPQGMSWDLPRSQRTQRCTSKSIAWTDRSDVPNSGHEPQGYTSMGDEPSRGIDKFAKLLVKLKGKFAIANDRIEHRHPSNSHESACKE